MHAPPSALVIQASPTVASRWRQESKTKSVERRKGEKHQVRLQTYMHFTNTTAYKFLFLYIYIHDLFIDLVLL